MAASPLVPFVDQIRLWILTGFTNVQIVESLREEFGLVTSEASIRRAIDNPVFVLKQAAEQRSLKEQLLLQSESPGIKQTKDEVVITDAATWESRPVSTLTTSDLLARHQLDPEEWEVVSTLVNQWEANAGEGTKIPLFQFKVTFKRKVPISILLPAQPEWTTFYTPKVPDPSKPVITVVETDPQCPFILEELDYLAVQFINHLQPDRHIVGGDLMNLGYISRHRDNPKWDDTANEAKQTAFDYLYRRREAAPDMEMWLIPGNHDDRLRNEQLERNERLYGITQAHYPNEPEGPRVYSLSHLLRLPELGVNYSEPEGTYEFEFVEITPLLAVRHGHKISQGAPMKTANELGHSVILGHTHSQSANAQTIWNKIQGSWEVRWAIEAGCECEIEEGLGFNRAGAPDWQPGFVTVASFPDGRFTFDFAHYSQDGRLYWRDKSWSV